MTSPIRVHRPKCVFVGYTFAQFKPWTTRRGGGDRCTCFDMKDGSRPLVIPGVDYNKGLVVCIVEWRKTHHRDQTQPGDWYIFAWTTAPDKASWNGAAEEAGNASKARFYIANNATQVREYVRANPTHFPPDPLHLLPTIADYTRPMVEAMGAKIDRVYFDSIVEGARHYQDLIGKSITIEIPNTPVSTDLMDIMYGTDTPKEGTMNTDALRRQAMALLEQADKIDARPDEPKGVKVAKKPKVEANIVWWRMRFSTTGRWYTYAAVKADGLWFTTGPRAPKGYTWEQLITWIYESHEQGEGSEPVLYYVESLSV